MAERLRGQLQINTDSERSTDRFPRKGLPDLEDAATSGENTTDPSCVVERRGGATTRFFFTPGNFAEDGETRLPGMLSGVVVIDSLLFQYLSLVSCFAGCLVLSGKSVLLELDLPNKT